MKVYSIGREAGCNIVINDATDVISRRHAVLNVSPTGKMTIVDLSYNGTYVNGIRISKNVPVPVTRKDNISFAHIARLDWNLVPNSNIVMKYSIIGVVALLLIIGGVFGYNAISDGSDSEPNAPAATAAVTDSTNTAKTAEQIKKEIQDSIDKAKAKQDSIKKAKGGQEKVCHTCKKKISQCQYKGNHPSKEKVCPDCKKDVKDCKYKGKHPKDVTRGDK